MIAVEWVVAWLVVGTVVGWLADMMLKSKQQGKLITIGVGLIGGVIGGVLFYAVGVSGTAGFNIWSLFAAGVGAVALIVVMRTLSGVRDMLVQP